jgi:hypothetical protein
MTPGETYLERMASEITWLRQRVAALEARERPRQPINQVTCAYVVPPNHLYVVDLIDLGTTGTIDLQEGAVLMLLG